MKPSKLAERLTVRIVDFEKNGLGARNGSFHRPGAKPGNKNAANSITFDTSIHGNGCKVTWPPVAGDDNCARPMGDPDHRRVIRNAGSVTPVMTNKRAA